MSPEQKPHPGGHHRFLITCELCGEQGHVALSLVTGTDHVEVIDPSNAHDHALAVALLTWYDTTHGSTIGEHDHHCLANAPGEKRGYCTCGWQAVADADRARTEARLIQKGSNDGSTNT